MRHFFDERGVYIGSVAIGSIKTEQRVKIIENEKPFYTNDVKLKNGVVIETLKSLSMREARQRLILAGVFQQVNALIDGMPEGTQKLLMQNWWEYAQTIDRNNPQTQAMAAQLKPDPAEREAFLDQMFAVEFGAS